MALANHGRGSGGEPLATLLRTGNAGSDTAVGHQTMPATALHSLPENHSTRPDRMTLARTVAASAPHDVRTTLAFTRIQHSVRPTLTPQLVELVVQVRVPVWQPVLDADGDPREDPEFIELTHMADLSGPPEGRRLIIRAEKPRYLY